MAPIVFTVAAMDGIAKSGKQKKYQKWCNLHNHLQSRQSKASNSKEWALMMKEAFQESYTLQVLTMLASKMRSSWYGKLLCQMSSQVSKLPSTWQTIHTGTCLVISNTKASQIILCKSTLASYWRLMMFRRQLGKSYQW